MILAAGNITLPERSYPTNNFFDWKTQFCWWLWASCFVCLFVCYRHDGINILLVCSCAWLYHSTWQALLFNHPRGAFDPKLTILPSVYRREVVLHMLPCFASELPSVLRERARIQLESLHVHTSSLLYSSSLEMLPYWLSPNENQLIANTNHHPQGPSFPTGATRWIFNI